jgi:hypothetical protein
MGSVVFHVVIGMLMEVDIIVVLTMNYHQRREKNELPISTIIY